MQGSISMRGTWKWAVAILTATTASAWIFSMTNREPSVDPLRVAYNGTQGATVCWNVDGKLQCSTSTSTWPAAMPFERMLMEMSLRSR